MVIKYIVINIHSCVRKHISICKRSIHVNIILSLKHVRIEASSANWSWYIKTFCIHGLRDYVEISISEVKNKKNIKSSFNIINNNFNWMGIFYKQRGNLLGLSVSTEGRRQMVTAMVSNLRARPALQEKLRWLCWSLEFWSEVSLPHSKNSEGVSLHVAPPANRQNRKTCHIR